MHKKNLKRLSSELVYVILRRLRQDDFNNKFTNIIMNIYLKLIYKSVLKNNVSLYIIDITDYY